MFHRHTNIPPLFLVQTPRDVPKKKNPPRARRSKLRLDKFLSFYRLEIRLTGQMLVVETPATIPGN